MLTDLFTRLRAWHLAGQPPAAGLRPLGKFEAWSLVRNVCVFAGLADLYQPTPNRENNRTRLVRTITDGLMALDPGGEGLTANAVVKRLTDAAWDASETVRDAVDAAAEMLDRVTAVALGKILASEKGRNLDGIRIVEKAGRDRTKVAKWTAVRVDEPDEQTDTDPPPPTSESPASPAGGETSEHALAGDAGDGDWGSAVAAADRTKRSCRAQNNPHRDTVLNKGGRVKSRTAMPRVRSLHWSEDSLSGILHTFEPTGRQRPPHKRFCPMRLPLAVFGLCLSISARADDQFETHIRPLLIEKCVGCHGPSKQKGGLRLDSKAGWQTGGDSGTAIRPGMPDDSLLMKAVRGQGGLKQMPPDTKLSDTEVAVLAKWIADGAVDPRGGGPAKLGGVTVEDARKWWAFLPVAKTSVPGSRFQVPSPHAIDAFIRQKLEKAGLSLSPPADRRTLLRRATFDLTGLPPTPAEVDAFLVDDSPDAFAKVVDRLLASPHYGERWGRHWLDLVRYADTAGATSDHPAPHAWRYRNWVIDAFNRDQPYDEFLREQLAGDLLAAKGPPERYAPRVVATGFLAVARRFDHDITKSMHLTHEDGIDTLGKAVLGLTLGCARCHDHKYDPITARDYYALFGIFESTRFPFPGCEHTQQPRDMVPLTPPGEWERTVKPYQEKLAKLDAALAAARGQQQKSAQEVQGQFVKARNVLSTGELADGGEKAFDGGKEIDIKEGEVIFLSVTPLKNHGADTTLTELEVAEVGGMKRVWDATGDLVPDLLAGNPHADSHGNKHVWWLVDTRGGPTLLPEAVKDTNGKPGLHAWRNGDTPSVVVNRTDKEITAWTKLPAMALFTHPGQNGNVGLVWVSPVSGKITVKGRLKDAHPGGPDGVGWLLEHFAADVRKPFLAQAGAAANTRAIAKERAEHTKNPPKQDVAYAVAEGKAADAKLHLRGDPQKPGQVVPRRWLEVLGGTPLKDKAASGRLELADWIAAKDNPLTARVMVNRIWLHHFGKGLVRTPNDFGTRGTPPTHPELLDWLAAEFVKSGWSVKAMHRTILLSAAYQQSSTTRPDAAKADPANDLYWRSDRRRLTAEEIRDSLLAVSGQLDRTPAEAHPFPPEAGWSYTQHVPFGTFYDTDKRSVYLIQVRNRRHPFLGLFDGADPNASTPQRQTTTVPTQALYFLNDPFFHAQGEKLAAHVLAKPEAERAGELFRLALQRPPTDKDREFADAFLARYRKAEATNAEETAWAALARVLLASNEFLFVD